MTIEIFLRNVYLSLLKTKTTKQYSISIAFDRERNTSVEDRAEFSSFILFITCCDLGHATEAL